MMASTKVRALLSASIAALGLAVGTAADQASGPVPRGLTPTNRAAFTSGPTAISLARAPMAVVLQADGRLISFDMRQGTIGSELFRVSPDYQAVDVAASAQGVTAMTLNARSKGAYNSSVLQLMPDRRQVWTQLPRGVYVGVVLDSGGRVAYVANSTDNTIYRVRIGDERSRVEKVVRVDEANQIGVLAIDAAGNRLFVCDQDEGQMFIVPLGRPTAIKSINLEGAQDIRAVAWSASAKKVFLADAAQEAVWSVDPERPSQVGRLRDKRFREPAGLAALDDGMLWLVDEGARSAFQIAAAQNAVVREIKWEVAAAKR